MTQEVQDNKVPKELLEIMQTLGHEIIFFSIDRIEKIHDEHPNLSPTLLYWSLLEVVRPMYLTLMEAGIKQFGEEFKELLNYDDKLSKNEVH